MSSQYSFMSIQPVEKVSASGTICISADMEIRPIAVVCACQNQTVCRESPELESAFAIREVATYRGAKA